MEVEQAQYDLEDRLCEYESSWRSGTIPDIAAYLRAAGANGQFVCDLIEIDLEYRWRRYEVGNPPTDGAVDDFGFPLFPTLDDYAAIETVDAALVLTARLAAEEYRVRCRWGDAPARDAFVERYSLDGGELSAAIDRVDTELEHEHSSWTADTFWDAIPSLDTTVSIAGVRRESAAEQRAPGGRVKQLGRYRLEAPIGRGGFGEVWKAFDPELERTVAVKFPRRDRHFPPEVLASFRAEGQKLAKLGRIPGIVTVFDTGEHKGRPFIVSDFIEGESLEARLQRDKTLPSEEAAALVARVADALHRAHLKGLVHRDIKPGNILLDDEGNPYLADFGLAATDDDLLREPAAPLGTYAYMSPEQARGDSNRVDGRTDIWSLGVVLYRALTGNLPFIGKTGPEYIDRILHDEPRPLSIHIDDIPIQLRETCTKCLRKAVTERFESCRELAKALSAVTPQRPAAGKRMRIVMATAVGIVASVVLLVVQGLWRPQPVGRQAMNPRELSFPADSASNWRVLDTNDGVQVFANGLSLIHIATNGPDDFQFSFRVLQLKWTGKVGVFFGYAMGQTVNSKGTFQTIELVPTSKSTVKLQRRWLAFFRRAPDKPTGFDTIMTSGEYPLLSGANRIGLAFKGGRLVAVLLNGAPVPELISNRQRTIPDVGKLGFFNFYSSGVFTSPSINGASVVLTGR